MEDAGRRYVESEVAALELEQEETDRLASQLETRLRIVMKSGVVASVFLGGVSCGLSSQTFLLTCLFSYFRPSVSTDLWHTHTRKPVY